MKKKWIMSHCDLDLWRKVTNFNRVRVSAISNHLAKTASKSVHSFGWNYVHKQNWTHTHRHTHTDKLKYDPSMISWRCKKHSENADTSMSLAFTCEETCQLKCSFSIKSTWLSYTVNCNKYNIMYLQYQLPSTAQWLAC